MGLFVIPDEREFSDKDIEQITIKNQVTVFGFACDHTPALMPLPIWLVHPLARRLTAVRLQRILPYLAVDGWTQVDVEYRNRQSARIHCPTVIASQNYLVLDGGPDLKRLQAALREVVLDYIFRTVVTSLYIHTLSNWR